MVTVIKYLLWDTDKKGESKIQGSLISNCTTQNGYFN